MGYRPRSGSHRKSQRKITDNPVPFIKRPKHRLRALFLCIDAFAAANGQSVEFNNVNVNCTGGNVEFTGVTVNTTSGPIFEVHSPATFTDCTFTSDYPIDVYNTGGEVTVDGGNYTGTKAVIKIDALSDNANPSVVNVAAGTFKGDVQAVENSQ